MFQKERAMRTESRRYVLSGRTGWVRLSIVVWLVLVGEFVAHSAIAQGAMTGRAQAWQNLRFDHIVIVIEENKNLKDVIGNTTNALYINQLASIGASFTDAHGEWHPSQPNYFALFSGSMQGLVGDKCPAQTPDKTVISPNQSLGGELLKHQNPTYSFGTYSENLPLPLPGQKPNDYLKSCFAYKDQNGQLIETNTDPTKESGNKNDPRDQYVRKHNPWISFTDVPASAIHDWQGFPNNATDYAKDPKACNATGANAYSKLPTVSFVIPNDQHEMHTAADLSAKVQQGNTWLNQHMSCYAQWAVSHNSLLIVTWDEDGSSDACDPKKTQPVMCPVGAVKYPDMEHTGTKPEDNHIPTIFVGAHVKPGMYDEWINHYNILRTLEDMYGLPPLGLSAGVEPIMDIWK
jgi:hypothetical protein